MKNKEKTLEQLFEFLAIPSISTDPKYFSACVAGADWVEGYFNSIGLDKVKAYKTAGNPIVYAEKIIDPKLPTILVYGHYDVQPADPANEWTNPAFEPEIRNGKVYARGASDDKGQAFIQMKAVEEMIEENSLCCNVKFVIEGEEEAYAGNLEIFCDEYKDMLSADICLISDTGMLSYEDPTIDVGMRGIAYFQLLVKGAKRDMHSGVYGGAVINPLNILNQFLGGMQGEDGRILIPGFYDDLDMVSLQESVQISQIPFDIEAFGSDIGEIDFLGDPRVSFLEKTGYWPSFDVHGIVGGYMEEGTKTVIPSSAEAKFSFRLAKGQDPFRTQNLINDYVKQKMPKSVEYNLRYCGVSKPWVTDLDSPGFRAASKAIESGYGKVPSPVRTGGSIPIVSYFEEELGLPVILLGFGLESDAIHAPDEHLSVDGFFKGIETVKAFYQEFSK